MSEEQVTISKSKYNQLLRSERVLDALEAGGVDNWQGYSFAMEDFVEDED